jgi:hypothetical protein
VLKRLADEAINPFLFLGSEEAAFNEQIGH